MIFVDASALVSILAEEAEVGRKCFEALQRSDAALTSPLALWETTVAVQRKMELGEMAVGHLSPSLLVQGFVEKLGIGVQAPWPDVWIRAYEAWVKFGRRSGHPAKLNFADCFHYADTKDFAEAILFTSPNEFHHTDLASVLPEP
ncbi:MAG: type II toxin-antitoxin system VapC family toxin [Hyphomonadaceae bacterium]|nr:type II toxin-antitoxin system VapC family toxin [Hyphomonadaceae bacterium]